MHRAESSCRTRFLLYSHDSWGLGHLRRTLTVASALGERFEGAAILVVTGSPCATQFPLPPGVALVKIPSISKDASGAYCSPNLDGSLDSLLRLRAQLLLQAFRSFEPHVLIVDHKVVGLQGEVLEVLRAARRSGVKTVLGLRDIIDSPSVVARRWREPDHRWALRQGYDRICVYGVPEVFDPRREYPVLGDLGDRVHFTGYVVRRRALNGVSASGGARVLVTTGGGQDGADRIRVYLESLTSRPAPWHSVVLTGPLMEPHEIRRIRRLARGRAGVEVHRFIPNLPKLLNGSRVVVAMAGYNTAAEILQSGRLAVFLPRTFPRREQQLRAERFANLGLARTLPDPHPGLLRELVEESLEAEYRPTVTPSLDGAQSLCDVVSELLGLTQPNRLPSRSQPTCQRSSPTC